MSHYLPTDMKTRPLTKEELSRLRSHLAKLNLPKGKSARTIGVSPETLLAALTGKRIQPAKRAILLACEIPTERTQ